MWALRLAYKVEIGPARRLPRAYGREVDDGRVAEAARGIARQPSSWMMRLACCPVACSASSQVTLASARDRKTSRCRGRRRVPAGIPHRGRRRGGDGLRGAGRGRDSRVP